ncbi:MAG: head-tail connector protein [Pseudomonadota bacterium]
MTVALNLVAAPTAPLLTPADARAQSRIDRTAEEVAQDNPEDGLIADLIAAVTAHLDGKDGILGRALITQTWRASYAAPPLSRAIQLPLQPVQSVLSVGYRDQTGADQIVAADQYRGLPGEDGGLELVSGASWPNVGDGRRAFFVEFTAGYGDAATDVPEAIRHAARMLVAYYFEHREAAAVGVSAALLPLTVKTLLAPYRRWGFE